MNEIGNIWLLYLYCNIAKSGWRSQRGPVRRVGARGGCGRDNAAGVGGLPSGHQGQRMPAVGQDGGSRFNLAPP